MCGALDTCAHVAGTALDSTLAFATCVCVYVFIYVGMYVGRCLWIAHLRLPHVYVCTWVCMCVYVCGSHTCLHHLCLRVSVCMCSYMCEYACACVCIHVCTGTRMHECMSVWVFVCMCVCKGEGGGGDRVAHLYSRSLSRSLSHARVTCGNAEEAAGAGRVERPLPRGPDAWRAAGVGL